MGFLETWVPHECDGVSKEKCPESMARAAPMGSRAYRSVERRKVTKLHDYVCPIQTKDFLGSAE